LAGAGPMKTVWDPTKRVYRNVPVAVQPKKWTQTNIQCIPKMTDTIVSAILTHQCNAAQWL
jgi:hypothetical protein